MKKSRNSLYLCLFAFAVSFTCAFSQSADEEIFIPADTSKKYPLFSPINTVSCETYEEDETDDEITRLYGDFNTSIIHQYKYKEIFQTRDSLVINLDKNNFSVPFDGKINSHYGWRKHRPHYGTDIDLERGDSVKCAFDGIVRYVNKKVKGYGQVIVIRHFNGLETIYGHLSRILVNTNDTIRAGDIIGLGGSTGRSTGPHLHFEIRCLGVPINSEDIIDYENKCLKKDMFILTKKDAEETYNLRSKKHQHLAKHKRIYIVKKGDTLSTIARKTGTPLSILLKKNKLKQNSILRPGKKLYL